MGRTLLADSSASVHANAAPAPRSLRDGQSASRFLRCSADHQHATQSSPDASTIMNVLHTATERERTRELRTCSGRRREAQIRTHQPQPNRHAPLTSFSGRMPAMYVNAVWQDDVGRRRAVRWEPFCWQRHRFCNRASSSDASHSAKAHTQNALGSQAGMALSDFQQNTQHCNRKQ